jgi:methionyl-tRNA formyltransferase
MSQALRILFMGTPDFAVPSLQALIDGPHQVVAVICQPDRPKGRGRVLTPPPVKVLAEQAGITVLQPTKIKTDEFHAQLQELQPDLMVVAAYGRILPGRILRVPRLGAINVHGSLLPKYRGAAPIQWAVINGETTTGITIMQMDEGMDTGDILVQASLDIGPQDSTGTVFDRLARLGGQTLSDAIERLVAGQLTPIKQDDSLATTAPMLSKEQGHLDWSQPAPSLCNLIRGLDPWPSAYSFVDSTRYRLFSPRLTDETIEAPPGTIGRIDGQGLLVATGQGALVIEELQAEGRRRMAVADCLHGLPLTPSTRFS